MPSTERAMPHIVSGLVFSFSLEKRSANNILKAPNGIGSNPVQIVSSEMSPHINEAMAKAFLPFCPRICIKLSKSVIGTFPFRLYHRKSAAVNPLLFRIFAVVADLGSAGTLPLEVFGDEGIQLTVENSVCIGSAVSGTLILYKSVGLKEI